MCNIGDLCDLDLDLSSLELIDVLYIQMPISTAYSTDKDHLAWNTKSLRAQQSKQQDYFIVAA